VYKIKLKCILHINNYYNVKPPETDMTNNSLAYLFFNKDVFIYMIGKYIFTLNKHKII